MKALSRWIVAACAAVLFAGSALALDVPSLTGRVVDNAKVLTEEQKRDLTGILERLERETTAQVVILTVPSLKGDTPFEFSQRVFDTWKLGQKGKDNGLLMLFAIKEKKGRIHTGYGLAPLIPEGAERVRMAERLIIPHLPSWRNKKGDDDYHAAMKAGVERIVMLIKGEAKTGDLPPEPDKKGDGGLLWLFVVAFFVAALFGAAHPLMGGVIGAVCFALIAWIVALTIGGIAIAALIGFIVGVVGHWVPIGEIGVAVFTGGGGGSGGGGFDF